MVHPKDLQALQDKLDNMQRVHDFLQHIANGEAGYSNVLKPLFDCYILEELSLSIDDDKQFEELCSMFDADFSYSFDNEYKDNNGNTVRCTYLDGSLSCNGDSAKAIIARYKVVKEATADDKALLAKADDVDVAKYILNSFVAAAAKYGLAPDKATDLLKDLTSFAVISGRK